VTEQPIWKPRPDPALTRPLRVGVRPHLHPPDRLHGWVFLQHQVWVDYWGNEHEVEQMPLSYVANVISFCEGQAERIRLLVLLEEAYVALLRLVGILPGAPPDGSCAYAPPQHEWTRSSRATRSSTGCTDSRSSPRLMIACCGDDEDRRSTDKYRCGEDEST
jgi:hypothetical protein